MLGLLRRTVIGGLALAVAALPLTALAQKPSTLKIVMTSDLKVIDPIWVSAQIIRTHAYLVYDTLFALDADLKPQPQMVDSYTVSDDKLVYTFKLRDGLQWHDGKPVTAEDCVQSVKRWASRDGVGQRLLAHTQAFDVVDDKTFKLTLKDAYGFVLASLAKPGSTVPFMMPKRIADTPGTQQISEATGSGPWIFKTDEWKPGEKVVYIKNPNYKPRAEPSLGPGWRQGRQVRPHRMDLDPRRANGGERPGKRRGRCHGGVAARPDADAGKQQVCRLHARQIPEPIHLPPELAASADGQSEGP